MANKQIRKGCLELARKLQMETKNDKDDGIATEENPNPRDDQSESFLKTPLQAVR
jgi:hypothetical protein